MSGEDRCRFRFDEVSVIEHSFEHSSEASGGLALAAASLAIHRDPSNLESKRPLTDGGWIVKNRFPSIISESQLCNNSFPLSVGADLL